MSFRTRITLHEIKPFHRHVELCILGIEKQHELAAARSEIEHLQAAEPRDSVVDVHDEITRLQITKVGKKGGRLRFSFSAFCLLPFAFRPWRASLKGLRTGLIKKVGFNMR